MTFLSAVCLTPTHMPSGPYLTGCVLAFEAELAHLPRSLIAAIWIAHDSIDSVDSQRQRDLRSRRS